MKKPNLRLIKSKVYEPKIYEKTFSYNLELAGIITLAGEDKEELDRLCQLGTSILDHVEFKEALSKEIYRLIAERLEDS